MKGVILKCISLYQFFSKDLAWWGSSCTFYPSCSEYGREAVEEYGVIKGGWLLIKRIVRCRPGKSYTIDFLK